MRAMSVDDYGAAARLYNVDAERLGLRSRLDGDDVDELIGVQGIDLPFDSRVVFDGEVMLGWALVVPPRGWRETTVVGLQLTVAADRPDVAERLLDWQERRAAEICPPAGIMSAHIMAHDAERIDWLDRRGFAPERWWHVMERDLTVLIREEPADPHVAIVPAADKYSELARRAHNEAFAEQWGFADETAQSWAVAAAQPSYRRELSFLAITDGFDVAPEVVSYTFLTGTEAGAETGTEDPAARRRVVVELVGTCPQWRGRGLATALLTRSLRAAAEAGWRTAELRVDSENPNDATAIYQRLGFTTVALSVSYQRSITACVPG